MLTSTFPRWLGDKEPPFVFELSRRLAKRFDVMVLAPHAPGAQRTETMGNLDVHRFRYFYSPWQSLAYHGGIMANLKQKRWRYLLVPLFLSSELFSLIYLLRKYRFDAIHAHWTIPNGLIAVVARALSARGKTGIVCTSHGTDLLGLRGRGFKWLQQKVLTSGDRLTVVSQALKVHAINLVPREEVEVIPMGVDLTGVFIPPAEPIRSTAELLFVGRLVAQKGVEYLIKAMPEVIGRHPQTTLSIVGDGPEQENLIRLAHACGVEQQVNFHDAIENAGLQMFYARAAIFVSPSLSEGFGLAIVEASGCECPVVSTDLPAIRDIVLDGVTGLLCRPGDSVDLAAKVCYLLEHAEVRETMGRSARQRVLERFDWTTISGKYAALIDALTVRPR